MGKVPGSGRKKGTPNKVRTPDLQNLAEELGINPFEVLLCYAAGDWQALGYKKECDTKYTIQGEPYEVRVITPEVRVKAAAEACQYLFAKKREIQILPEDPEPESPPDKRSFSEFCEKAGYPKPFDKQLEMMNFGMAETVPRLLLGSRGYGKTDYVTILGTAYMLYLKGTDLTVLIVSKSKVRNSAMIGEIAGALLANDVALAKQNSSCLRLEGLLGKDHSVEALTIRSSFRGRHPKISVMDDPVTDEDVSEAMRKLVKRKYNEIMKLCDNVLVIGQPAHKHDLYSELRPLVKRMEMPYGSIPELDHNLEAQRLAGVDEASIQASYFLKVSSESASPFDKINYIDKFPTGVTSVAFLDPSDGGNDTAVSIFRMMGHACAVVGFSWKRSWHHCLDDLIVVFQRFGTKSMCFETNKHGTQPLDVLRSKFKAAKLEIGVDGRYSNGNKHSRIMAAGVFAPLIHLSKESDKNYIKQVVEYEVNSKIDDAPDSLATGLEWLGLVRGKL